MRFYPYVAIQIAPWAAISAWLAFIGNSDTLSFMYAGRNLNADDPFFGNSARTFALFAGFGDNFAFASTGWTGRNHLEEATTLGDLAGSPAGWTLTWRGAFSTTTAGALRANILTCKFNGFLGAFFNIVEG